MTNDGNPPNKGTTQQVTPPDDPLITAAQQLVQGLLPKETAQKVDAEIRARIIRAVSNVPRESLQNTSSLLAPTSYLDAAIDLALRQLLKDRTTQTVNAVNAGKALANPQGVNARQGQQAVADPVDPATGQLIYTYTDLSLDGAGIPFEFIRTYRSQAHYPNGPLGAGWDYNLNLWLHKISDEVIICNSGELREDRYTLTVPRQGAPDETPYYAPPAGFHAILMPNQQNSFDLVRPDGLTYQFEVDTDDTSGQFLLHRIRKISDRFGNSLMFEYINTLATRAIRISVNDPTRIVTLHFDDLGRIDAIGDYSGRVVRYTYDEYDDLVAVTLPATKDYRLGRSIFYEYSSETGPAAHQLLRITDADGRCYLDVEYGNDDGFVDFAHVVRQRDDQGEWLFEYATIPSEAQEDIFSALFPYDASDINTATRYTKMVRPTGHTIEHWFNKGGNLLFKLERFFDEDGNEVSLPWRFLYNDDGNTIASLTPAGVLTQDLYGRDAYLLSLGHAASDSLAADIAPTADERRAFGKHLGRVRRVSVAWPPPFPVTTIFAEDVVMRFTYEPAFQLLASQSDPRATTSLDPSAPARVTTYHYRADGALLTITHPATTGPDGVLAPPAVEQFDHDTRGRLIESIDAEGHITQRHYFPAGQTRKPEVVPSTEMPLSPLIDVSIEGHLQAITVGKGEADEATTSFDVNARGVHIAVTDPRSFSTSMKIDTTNQPTEVTHVLVRQGKPAIAYTTSFTYTLEGKVKRQDRPAQDDEGNALLDGHEIHYHRYNDTGLLIHEDVGGLAPNTWLRTRHVHDAEGLLQRTISPGGSVTHFHYEARRLLVATTHGFGTPEAATERIRYERDGRKRATVDGRGNVTRYDYDSFGRVRTVVQIVDRPVGSVDDRPLQVRQGHTRLFIYDKLDQVTEETFFEWRAPDTYALLSRTATVYDERGRAVKVSRDLFADPVVIQVTAGDLAPQLVNVVSGTATPIETWLFLDGNSRLVERREGVVTVGPAKSLGSSTQFTYDASGRQSSTTIHLLDQQSQPVTQTITTYDLNGNPVRVDQYDFEYNSSGALINTEVLSKEAEFDSLNRRVADIDGLGNRTERRYDSRDLLIEQRDPLGNLVQFQYDHYGRRTQSTEAVDTTNSIITTYQYDTDGQVISIIRGDSTHPNLTTIRYEYDALHRRTATILAALTLLERSTTTRYDAAGNISERIHANKLKESMQYDALNRLARVDFDSADSVVPVLGATFERFEHDALGRQTHAENDLSTVDTSFDSLGRPTQERQTASGVSSTITRVFDPLGNRTQLVYPSGRTLDFQFDLASRLVEIKDSKRGTPNVGLPGAGVRHLLTRSYIGMRRRQQRYGNATSTEYVYDAAGRTIAIHHKDPNGHSLLQLVSLYDAAGQRRHDWQGGSASLVPSLCYSYDGMHRLTVIGNSATLLPDLTPFLPPSTAKHPLDGQTQVDKVLAPLDIPPAGVQDSYTYDAGGNRLSEQSPASNYSVDPLDQINGQQYDRDGNPLAIAKGVCRFDQRGRLVEVKDGSGQVIFSAIYDALGRRCIMKDATGEIRFIYNGSSEIAEYENGVLFCEHVVAGPPDDRIHVSVANEEYIVHRDFVGSSRLLTEKNGNVVARYEFDPYGRVVLGGFEGPPYRYRFMGREWDASIELYHFRARHYEVETGRFLQRDPLNAAPGRSAYQAFDSNPLIYIDPFGMQKGHIGDGEHAAWWKYPLIPIVGAIGLALNTLTGGEDEGNPTRPQFTTSERAVNLIPLFVGVAAAGGLAELGMGGAAGGSGLSLLPDLGLPLDSWLVQAFTFGSTQAITDRGIRDFRSRNISGPLDYGWTGISGGAQAIPWFGVSRLLAPGAGWEIGGEEKPVINSVDEVIVRKTVPLDDLSFIRGKGSVGYGQRTYVTLPRDMEGVVGMEDVYDKLALNYKGTKFTRSGTAIELEFRVPNQGFEPGEGTQGGLGWTEGSARVGEAMDLTAPSPSTSNITRFRIHSSGHTSPWIEGNPFQ